VGKRTWLGPALDAEITAAGAEELTVLLRLPAMLTSLQVEVKGNILKVTAFWPWPCMKERFVTRLLQGRVAGC